MKVLFFIDFFTSNNKTGFIKTKTKKMYIKLSNKINVNARKLVSLN